jgi:hypothetical protein
MKKHLLIFTFLLASSTCYSQEVITLSGGYITASAVDYSSHYPINYNNKGSGFRIKGNYEIGPLETKKLLHGFSMGYILTNSEIHEQGLDADVSIRTIPMYYAPKFMIGGERLKAFAHAAIGMQFAKFKIEGDVDGKDNDWGFFGGIGVGAMISFSRTVFMNLEYEFDYMSNTYYANGIINTVQVGIGLNLNMGSKYNSDEE